MITLAYSWTCLGTGREPCDTHGSGPKSNREAEKHTEAERHVTTTHARPEKSKR